MKPTVKKISPNLTIRAIKTDKFKSERISISFVNKIDKRRMPLSLLAFFILKRGTKKYNSLRELNKKLDELYATIVSTNVQRLGNNYLLGFSAEMLGAEFIDSNTDLLKETLEIIYEMIFNPLLVDGKFLEKYVISEKENMIDAINARINNPRAYALSRCVQLMYNDEFSVEQLGTAELIESFTGEDIINEYKYITSKCPINVFYVGSRDIEDVSSLILNMLKSKACDGALCCDNGINYDIDTRKTKYITEKMDISQGKLVLGFKSGVNLTCDKDFYSVLVLNEIFGGSPVSKLFLNVRERLGLCYYCSSSYTVTKGNIMVSCGVDPGDKDKAQKEILKQFRAIKKGQISNDEFSAAIKSLINGYSENYDYPSRLESFYELRASFSIDDSIDDCKKNILEVTVGDVVRIANQVKLDTVYFLYGDGKENADDTVL